MIDVNNIGYQVKVSLRVIEGLPGLGSQVKIHTYTYVREDVLALYGFLTKDDLQMFLLLLGVNGVGPKGALGILSMFSAQELRLAIISQDSKTIAKAPGIGAKTAQRMLIDLKDKVSVEETFEKMGAETVNVSSVKTEKKIDKTKVFYDTEQEYQIGQLVMHSIYGKGVIVSVDDKFVSVAFNKNYGIRKLMKNHSSIKKI